ncbi:hypothetical protein TEA_001567 [Camellia sinensis var. sinensis]|uniref:Aminotransferase class I/classII large domain-containing protein n=1 Tax=Camellia sinensis var. sinensis TaxID=542762 RepID=A0A4S4EXJ7_CAMSN|nr:hypothetical protein TEA_001567 [Camellia sinensis var. sinensis]
MAEKLSAVAKILTPSPIQQLSLLAQRCNAVNLAEGFPDFPAPPHIKNAAISAIVSDFNQYRHVQGICDHVAKIMKHMHGLDFNPLTDIAICCGQSEAFAATMFATIDKGDEVILFDPSFETYEACISMAGGIPCANSMIRDLNITINSEDFFTGWRIGWAVAPACIASAIRNIHTKLTDSAPAPFQEAALTALRSPLEYFESLRRDYESRRNYTIKLLAGVGFQVQFKPQADAYSKEKLDELGETHCSLTTHVKLKQVFVTLDDP